MRPAPSLLPALLEVSESQGENASSPPDDATGQDYMQHMTSALIVLHLSVFVTGLIGNLLVCLSVYRNKSLQTVTNYYIVNLAVADFLVILICLPPTLYWDLTLTWSFGLVLCKLVPYLQPEEYPLTEPAGAEKSISVSVSVLTLTCISLDRWYAICRPLEFCSTKGRAKKTIALVWLSSALFASPDLLYLTTKRLGEDESEPHVYMDCAHSWPEQNTRIYQLCISALLFLLPFLLMSVSYWHIVHVLWRSDQSLELECGGQVLAAAAAAAKDEDEGDGEGDGDGEPSNEINCHLSAQSIPANDQSSRAAREAPAPEPLGPAPAATKAPSSLGGAAAIKPRAGGAKNLHHQQQWGRRTGSTNQSAIETTTTIGSAAANGPLYGSPSATKSAGPFDASPPVDAANGATHGHDKAEAGPANDAASHGGGDPQPDNKGPGQGRRPGARAKPEPPPAACCRWCLWGGRGPAAADEQLSGAKTSRRYRKNLANYAARQVRFGPGGQRCGNSQALDEPAATRTRPSTPDGSDAVAQQHGAGSRNNAARFCKLIESRKKAAKMLIVIVIMFGLCYLPVHFLNVLRYTVGLPQNDLTQIASLVSHWLCYFNSAVNPLIYNLMSGKFRHEFANLFFFCRRQQ